MIPPVEIDFVARGVTDVGRAFDTIEQRMAAFEGHATRAARDGASQRKRVVDDERREKEASYKKLFDELKRQDDLQKRMARLRADDEIREAKRSAREQERLAEEMMRVRVRSSEAAGRAAAREVEQELRARQRVAHSVGAFGAREASRIGSMAGMVTGAVGIGGGFLLADALRREGAAQRQAALLVNSATIGGVPQLDDRGRPASVGTVLARASQVSRAYGVDKGEILGAMQDYVAKSSDFRGGMENADFFAKLSVASGSRLTDITGAAGMLKAQNKDLSSADIRQMLMDITEQGKQGAVEISDLARLAGGLGSSRGMYRGNTAETQRKLLAMAQITRTEGTSPEEAMTAVTDLGAEALKKSRTAEAPEWLKKVTRGGLIESPEALIEAGLRGTGGDLGKLIHTFDARGARAFERLAPIYNAAGGGDAGIAAVRREMGPILGARGSMASIDEQAATVMNEPMAKFERELNGVKETLAQGLEPALAHFAEKLPEIMPVVDRFIEKFLEVVDWFARNPLEGLGGVVLAKVIADIGQAAIGAALRETLTGAVRGMLGVKVPGVEGGGGAGFSPRFGEAGVITAAIGIGAQETSSILEGTKAGVLAGDNRVARMRADLASGKMTAADLQAALAKADATIAAGPTDMALAGITGPLDAIAGSGGTGALGNKDAGQVQRDFAEALAIKKHTDDFKAALDSATAALKVASATAADNKARHVPIDLRDH